MGGFSSNYEGGYLDFNEDPKWMSKEEKKESRYAYLRQKKVYRKTSGSSAEYLNILLSPLKLLNTSEQHVRTELCDIDDEDIELTLKQSDEALKVYYNGVYIGNIQELFEEDQIDNRAILHDFCFSEMKLQNIQIIWDGEGFYLKKTRV